MRVILTGLFIFFLLSGIKSFAGRILDTTEVINIGGIKQFIRIKGKDDSKPILLFLHGGPGGSLMQKNDAITGKLQEHFIVIQWDQRETGQTLKLNHSPAPLQLEMFYHDTHDLIDSILKQFNKPKLYLAGYSWGSGLGFHIAEKYPELLYAYLAISPVIDQLQSDSLSLAMLREKMGKPAEKELAQVKVPFENWEQLYIHRKWLLKNSGVKSVEPVLPRRFVGSWAKTWFDVWNKATTVNLFQTLPSIQCPVFFFAGGRDYNTSHLVTKQYFELLAAPKKDLFMFPDAGHELIETESLMFQNIVIEKIVSLDLDRVK